MINNTKKRVKKPGKFLRVVSTALLILTASGALYAAGNKQVQKYVDANSNYKVNNIASELEFYGGDTRYLTVNQNLFSLGVDSIYNHFDLNGDDSITISYEDSVSPEKREQFQYTFDYLNEVFETINPDIKFEVVDLPKKDSDIYIKMQSLKGLDAMQVVWDVDPINRSKIVGGVISVNKNMEFTDTELRFYMLHEMFHILTGSDDVNEKESPTISIFNYGDVAYMKMQIENSYPTAEARDEDMSKPGMHYYYPVMSEEMKNSYVSLMPTDLGSLIALYGDSSVPENKQNYIAFLINSVDECKIIFGEQRYFANKNVLENLKTELNKIQNKNNLTEFGK